jgi:MSHA pilin protein MshC
MPNRGFTLIEMVTVMIIIGIMAVIAIPNFSTSTSFANRGFHDAVWSAVTHARRTAVASRHFSCVTIVAGTGSAGQISLTRDLTDPDTYTSSSTVNCTSPIAIPAQAGCNGASNTICAPSSVTLGGTSSLIFDPLGRLVTSPQVVASSAASISVSGQNSISVQPGTGYVQ